MDKIEELRKNISIMDEKEIDRRLKADMFTDEARPIAEEELQRKRPFREETEELVEHRLQFVGSGSEYFRIWIVNLLFSIVTFGFYSAWAKVRREQYFHRNTLLDGSGFDYHGNPKSIFKGRIIAVALLAVLAQIDRMAHDFYYPVVLVLSPLIPWLMIRSFIFRSRNTSFRGLHFDFHGTYKGFCKVFLGPLIVLIALSGIWLYRIPLLVSWSLSFDKAMQVMQGMLAMTLIGAFLLIPVLLQRFKAFQFNHLAFGASRFESRLGLKSFYGICLRAFVLVLLIAGAAFAPVLVAIASITGDAVIAVAWGIILAYVVIFIVQQPYFVALLSNLVWNNTRLEKHGFRSDQTFGGIFRIVAGNWLFIIFTLGLYWPWAKIRIARYRAEHTAVLVAGSLDDFIGGATQQQSAIGEEIADAFDFDIGF
ncbi:MAG: DUF898 domain-containing protein [Azoarcus sp.]|jgi:uncharacterized membrane protein YjgN (DUF898 family)|nr:DUF898 domain-containing protein [Azoarcus sp.]